MNDGWISTEELLRRVPISGKRPDAVLKRLRDATLIPRPMGRGRGQGKGREWFYPPGTDKRLAAIEQLRGRGLRALRELRWELWYRGADDLWEPVQRDLLAAYPTEMADALDHLRDAGEDAFDDAIAEGAQVLGEQWRSHRHAAYDRRALHASEVDTLATVAIRAAIPGEEVDLARPLNIVEPGAKYGDVVDRAWGGGSVATADQLVASGAADVHRWLPALQSADASQARLMATLWALVFEGRLLERQFSLFGKRWGDRALLVATTLTAIQKGLVPAGP